MPIYCSGKIPQQCHNQDCHREFYKEAKQRKICISCGKPTNTNTTRCLKCLLIYHEEQECLKHESQLNPNKED